MVTTETNVVRYDFTSSVKDYRFSFPFQHRSEISVIATDSSDADSILKENQDYTVSFPGEAGVVSLLGDISSKTWKKITIVRDMQMTQTADLENNQKMDADVIEAALDRLAMQVQQIAEETSRTLKLPVTEAPGSTSLPHKTDRKGKVIGFADDGVTPKLYGNPDDALAAAEEANEKSEALLEEASTLKQAVVDAQTAAELAQEKAEDAQTAAEQAKADTQEIADNAEEAIGNSNSTGLRGDAIEAIQTALTNALASIGESDSAGARGDAIDAITTALNAALASIGQTDSTGARGEAITAIATALTDALAVIGQSNDAGARGAAITAISQALASALAAIGESNSAGARGEAISAVSEALEEALASIGTSDTAGARGDAITAIANALSSDLSSWKQQVSSDNTAWDSKVDSDNSAFDTKVAQANTTIDQKVLEASGYADDAEEAKNAAEAAQEAAEQARDDAQAVADIGPATETKLGLVKISGNARGTATDTAVSQAGMKAELDDIYTKNEVYKKSEVYSKNEIDQKLSDAASILPIPMVEAVFTSTGTGLQIVINNNYIGYGDVTVRYKIGSDPSETDAVATFPITNVQTGTYYFRAFPEEGSLDEPSPSAILELDTSKVMTPTYQWDDVTDSISFACQTPAADIRYTTDGLEPSATSGTPYTGPISITAQTTFKVKAFKGGMADSDTLSTTITKVATPTFSFVKNGESGTVTMGCSTAGAVIKYTTDGSEPTENNGTVYSGAITLNGTSTKYRIKAFLSGCVDSEEVQGDAVFAQIFAVQWNYGASPSEFTRITPETDPLNVVTETISTEPVPATASQAGSSPFDAYELFQQIKRRNFDADGAPSFWEDEEGFSVSNLDTLVWIPKFWVKVTDDASAQIRTYYLATDQMEGFQFHPGSGQYVGAYPTSNSKESKSGKTRQGSQSIVTMRTNAKTKGAGWGLIDIAERNAIQFLYIIEFANWNSQNMIGEGPTSDCPTGYSDVIGYHTGVGTSGVVKYRHIEGLWRSQYEWTDGLNVVGGQVCVSTDRDNYQSDVTEGYDILGTWTTENQNIQKLKYFEDKQWLISVPEYSAQSDYNTYVGDDGYIPGGTHVLSCGRSWNNSAYAGLFYFDASVSSSDTSSSRGSRLSYKDPSAA